MRNPDDSVMVLNDQGGSQMDVTKDVTHTLRAQDHGHPPLVAEPILLESNQDHATVTNTGVSPTLPAAMGNGGGYVPMITEPLMVEMTSTKNTIIEDGISCTLTARMGTGGNQVNVVLDGVGIHGDVAGTLDASYYKGFGERMGIERDVVLPFDTTQITHPANYSHPKPGDPCHPLAAGAHPPAVCFGIDQQGVKGGANYTVDVAPPILSDSHGTPHAVAIGNGQLHNLSMSEVSNTLDTMHDAQAVMVPDVAHALKNKGNCDFREDSETYVSTAVDCRNGTESAEVNGTLRAKSQGGYNMNSNNVCRTRNMVRRLTPLECTRLQGLPDSWVSIGDWVDDTGKLHKDSDTNKYRALGNSMAKPFWFWLLRRISATYERPATLGSLFDGIGVAPLCWEQINGTGTAVWASEIEPFCIAVTKKHFGDADAGIPGDVSLYF